MGLICRLWTRSLRLDLSPEAEASIRNTDSPTVLLLWHNRLFVAGEIYRRFRRPRPLCSLVSASRDGAWLTALLQSYGILAIRGSSSRRSLTATREMLVRIGAGDDIAITPDGPRGPCYRAQPGAVLVARHADSPIILVSCSYPGIRPIRLRSWDRFYIPLPFTRVCLHIARYSSYKAMGLPAERDRAAAEIERRLIELAAERGSRGA